MADGRCRGHRGPARSGRARADALYAAPVPRHVRLREFLVGVEGVALLRHLFQGGDNAAARRIEEVRRITGDAEEEIFGLGTDVPELDAGPGYAAWSQTYDQPGNPLVAVEEPA